MCWLSQKQLFPNRRKSSRRHFRLLFISTTLFKIHPEGLFSGGSEARGWETPSPAPQLPASRVAKIQSSHNPKSGNIVPSQDVLHEKSYSEPAAAFLGTAPQPAREAAIKGRVTMNSTFQWESIRCGGLGGMRVPRGVQGDKGPRGQGLGGGVQHTGGGLTRAGVVWSIPLGWCQCRPIDPLCIPIPRWMLEDHLDATLGREHGAVRPFGDGHGDAAAQRGRRGWCRGRGGKRSGWQPPDAGYAGVMDGSNPDSTPSSEVGHNATCPRHVPCPGHSPQGERSRGKQPRLHDHGKPHKVLTLPFSRASSPFHQPAFTRGVNIADLPLTRREGPSPRTQGSTETAWEARRVTGPLSPPQNSTHVFTASL